MKKILKLLFNVLDKDVVSNAGVIVDDFSVDVLVVSKASAGGILGNDELIVEASSVDIMEFNGVWQRWSSLRYNNCNKMSWVHE